MSFFTTAAAALALTGGHAAQPGRWQSAQHFHSPLYAQSHLSRELARMRTERIANHYPLNWRATRSRLRGSHQAKMLADFEEEDELVRDATDGGGGAASSAGAGKGKGAGTGDGDGASDEFPTMMDLHMLAKWRNDDLPNPVTGFYDKAWAVEGQQQEELQGVETAWAGMSQ